MEYRNLTNLRNSLKANFESQGLFAYSFLRSVSYTAQQLSLPLAEYLFTGKRKMTPPEHLENIKKAHGYLVNLLKKDIQNIQDGIYPMEVLSPESPLKHLLRIPKILLDGYFISKRKQEKKSEDFDAEAMENSSGAPDYAKRNYHFQTGGYFTQSSAELYEHQVEILFSGSADAMRRLIIPLLKKQIAASGKAENGECLNFLEVGAGTGRLSKFMKLAFPKAKLTITDLSSPYLKEAQKQLVEMNRVDFVQTPAEKLPFQENSFDVVYSCFLFHELPREVREQVIRDSHRVLKTDGLFGFVDSIQNDDVQDLTWALSQFPTEFHEPFYKNYIQTPMTQLITQNGFEFTSAEIGFFSKAILAKRVDSVLKVPSDIVSHSS
ncbi:MAG: class I SAM-dependent methyltransferase [Pseudobdellovibrionaceae bacterium]